MAELVNTGSHNRANVGALVRASALLTMCLLLSCSRERLVSPEPDMFPPLPPAGVRVESAHDGYIFIGWLKNMETDLKAYVVYRAEASRSGPYFVIDSTRTNYIIDLNRSYDTTYYYFVTALDNSGNRSAPSDTVGTMAPNEQDPDPTKVLYVFGRNTEGRKFLHIEWNAVVDGDVEGYEIYRSKSLPVLVNANNKIAFTNATMFDDSTVQEIAQSYYYCIVTVDRGGKKSISSAVEGDIITNVPLLLKPVSNELVFGAPSFSWQRVAGAIRYRLSISATAGEDELWYSVVEQTPNETVTAVYDGAPLDAGRSYYWKVSTLTKLNGVPNASSAARVFQIAF
jgi:hypothetical protein